MNLASPVPLPAPCRAARRRFSPALDDHLPQAEADALRRHLSSCAPCQEEWRQWTLLSNAAQSLPRAEAPAHLGERIRRTLQPPAEEGGARRPVWHWLGIAAAAAVLCALSFLAGMHQAGSSSGEPHLTGAAPPETAGGEAPGEAGSDAPGEAPDTDPPQEARPLRLVADRPFADAEGGGDPDRFARSTLALLGDVVELPSIEPELRGPLLNAQLVHFDLPRQARLWRTLPVTRPSEVGRTLDEAARRVEEVARSLEEDPSGGGLEDLRLQVLAEDLVPRLRQQLPHQEHRSLAGMDHALFLPLVQQAAPGLSDPFQESLARLLSLKDAWVSDRPSGHGDLDALDLLRSPMREEVDGAVEAMVRQLLSLGATEDTRTIVEEESGEHGGVQWQIRRVYTESHVFRTPDKD